MILDVIKKIYMNVIFFDNKIKMISRPPAARHNFLVTKSIKSINMPSSVVAAIKYDPQTSILRVIYTSGNIYDYKNVPEKVYNEMKQAFSKGEFLNKEIKPNYEFERIK
jgi:hypothetical protein